MLLMQLVAGLLLLLAATGLTIRLLHPLPPLEPRAPSARLTDTDDTALGRGISALRAEQAPHLSGIHMLDDSQDAFAARILLARRAERSLDLQYYIWRNDISGTLLLEAVRAAADRGVRVRLLLDDNGIAGLDTVLAALDLHPHIDVRLFNPFTIRQPKMFGYLADFPRLNRRMHNKSFIADGQATIIGGRNIGDEYFDARDDHLFSDLDVLAVGPVVDDTARDFDRYWASASAYPASRILPPVSVEEQTALSRRASLVERDIAARRYMEAIGALPFITPLVEGTLPFDWAPVRMISDDPAKGIGKAREDGMLTAALREAIGAPERELYLISGYFVPTRAGVEAFSALAARGVDVAIFTNSFEATDVWVVHAGYAERRKALLKAGIRLFEMRGPDGNEDARPRRKLIGAGSGSGGARGEGHVLRSSATTLHAKTFAVDDERLFIGSFNFDPRSMHLNTELGFVIESPRLATIVASRFETQIPARAYEVVLSEGNSLAWREQGADGALIHTSEPGTSALQRWGIRLLSHMPIEWLL